MAELGVGAETQIQPESVDAADIDPTSVVHDGKGSSKAGETVNPTLSKNQQKKLKRKADWEEKREQRREFRKERNKRAKQRKRAAYHNDASRVGVAEDRSRNAHDDHDEHAVDGLSSLLSADSIASRHPRHSATIPITFLVDCQFDELMTDNEITSLSSQLTRCYSENKKAPIRGNIVVSSFGGRLKERFETVLNRNHEGWKGVKFDDRDFVAVAEDAKTSMARQPIQKFVGALANRQNDEPGDTTSEGEIVYLTSESDTDLQYLKPHSTYIIGGIVDRNRHKGICYKKATERGLQTAKLPIGAFMDMASRKVLATNHVVEIMLRWLEYGDWGKAFGECIPKRKGGILKDGNASGDPAKDVAEAVEAAEYRSENT